MWKCPNCGRTFKNTEQEHFCVKPHSIDEYIAAQPEEAPAAKHPRNHLRRRAGSHGENLVTDTDVLAG